MSIDFKNITAKNFLSIGNATQGINLSRQDLTLILGENQDLGAGGSRNGVGKTSLLNAISYALYGQALTNIRKDNLINLTNAKGMLVSLEFAINGKEYRIERGRKPNVLKFYIDNKEQEAEDNAQGDSRKTQEAIERLLGMSHDLFKHVVALNTYTEPFLSLGANAQRQIIEQLLGITLLSEKAVATKDQIRATKDLQQAEEFRIRAIQEANKRVAEQIESLKTRQRLWNTKNNETITGLEQAIQQLEHIDIDAEVTAQRALNDYNEQSRQLTLLKTELNRERTDLKKAEREVSKLAAEIGSLQNHRCYACSQPFHDAKQAEVLAAKETARASHAAASVSHAAAIADLEARVAAIVLPQTKPVPFYGSLEEALSHKTTLEVLIRDLATAQNNVNPYTDQITDMELKALQEVSYDRINELTRLLEHQEFLLKLLTNKDSFIRKKIIDQNLSYLNSRLTYYLDKLGLPHEVVFLNDLSVQITELGRELDFDNLSRGERNRLIIGLSLSFRDVWELLYSPINLLFIDEMLDSGLDQVGTESAMAILKKMTRERKKSIWLISHRDELVGRVENILKVVKENGFTTFISDQQ